MGNRQETGRQCRVQGETDMGNKSSKGDKLTKEDLEFLRTHTRYDEGTITEWYRGFKQDCPDGRLTPGAFVKIYSKCFPPAMPGSSAIMSSELSTRTRTGSSISRSS